MILSESGDFFEKTGFILGLSLLLLLVGCGGADQAQPPQPAEQQSKNEPSQDATGQVTFTAVGQEADVPKVGHVTLKKIRNVNETVDLKPITVTIKDIKLFHVEKVSSELKQGIESLSQKKVGDTLDYLQIKYSAENTSDANVSFLGISTITTNTGQQIEVSFDDFILDDEMQMSDYLGKVRKEGLLGVPVKKADEIKHLKLFFDMVIDNESGETLKESQKVEYDF